MERFLDLLPIVIMVEMFLSTILYIIYHKWGSAIYWFAGGCLSYAVIFGIKRFG